MARVVFFAFDIAEAAQLRRIDSLRALGHGVVSVSFRRDNMEAQAAPDWPNLALGRSSNKRYGLRLLRLVRGAWRLWRRREILDGGTVWIARNLDMLLLAVFARGLVSGPPPRLVYECLDIHGLFTRADAIGAAMRWAERRMLRRCDLLILSSPGFLEHYFEPVQQVTTPVALLENKLWVSGPPPARPQTPRQRTETAPFILGWVGSLRCAKSLEILAGTAQRLGPEIEIRFHGAVHRHALPGFDASCARIPTSAMPGPIAIPMRSARSTRPAMRSGRRTFGNPGPTATGSYPTASTRRAISAVPPSRSRGRRPGGGWRRTGWASRSRRRRRRR
jgi:succinoglycan biosynthesis protein ExoL